MLIPVVWRIVIWVMGLEMCSVDSDSSGLCSVDSEKPVVSHHAQIKGPVNGATTHEKIQP
jgi:hypothetical protein